MAHDESKANPKEPHAFLERMNLPFNAPKPMTAGVTAMEVPVQRTSAPPECAICGRPRSDRIHEAAEEEADALEGRWPL